MLARRIGTLLVIGTGMEEYRAHGLRQIAASHRVTVLGSERSSWAHPLIAAHILSDMADAELTALAVKEFAAASPITGVMTYMEKHAEFAARLAQEMALPGPSPAAVSACRDKALTRRLLDEASVPSARAYVASSQEHAVDIAEFLGYPVVVKPRALSCSAGVRRAVNADEVHQAFRNASRFDLLGLTAADPRGVLVEEYIAGPEISVECVVLGPGRVHVAAVTRKELSDEPAFEELGHLVDANDELLNDEAVRSVATDALTAVGITHGVMHVEMRLSEDRGPRIIEINARLGGDLIPHLTQLATGVSLPLAAAALATGAEPDLEPTRQQAAGIRFLSPATEGRVQELHSAPPSGSWLERFVWTHKPGDYVSPPPHSTMLDRLAHFVVTGSDASTCRTRLQLVESRTAVQISPASRITAYVR
ncbi:ATP-grasp domain-containing protein [Streptomyces hygroscopicus]|uniref:ATP-grasp domain-containing protein n=1 Tax=Streptomyces hygroscopicus TaxID=1912 RepID=UPI001FCC039D|nr:ATP-grasp domain-containing protein [Streptomyces hygroscopicus]